VESTEVTKHLEVYEELRTINKRLEGLLQEKLDCLDRAKQIKEKVLKIDASTAILKVEAKDLTARLGLENSNG
tara:strand:- start:1288 stop:1506 length:219 start_codon:yes stop_codon:yes gene_type:complete